MREGDDQSDIGPCRTLVGGNSGVRQCGGASMVLAEEDRSKEGAASPLLCFPIQMNLSIFDIPLLQDGVTQHLTRRDLARCALVSKEWSAWFTPALWRCFNFAYRGTAATSQEGLSILSRHRLHIQTLKGFENYANTLTLDELPVFPNLVALECVSNIFYLFEHSLIQVVNDTPSLQTLSAVFSYFQEITQEQFLKMLESHPNLSSLDLTWYNLDQTPPIQQIIQACSNYESLRLNLRSSGAVGWETDANTNVGDGVGENTTAETDADDAADTDTKAAGCEPEENRAVARNAIEQMQDTRLRVLSIRLSFEYQEFDILVPLLRHCPQLYRLHLVSVCRPEALEQITDIFQNKGCPRLKHLELGLILSLREEPIARLIRATGCSSDDYHGGLKSLTMTDPLPFGEECVMAITKYHGATLTSLNLEVNMLPMSVFLKLVSNLPGLHSLVAAASLTQGDDIELRDFDKTVGKQWNCLGLRKLVLSLESERDDESPLEDSCMDYVFSQIGKFTELESWAMEVAFNELLLENRYLEQLQGLKELRTFDLRNYACFRVSVRQAEWMVDNWTRLVHLKLRGVSPTLVDDLDDYSLRETAEVMLRKRPWMEVDIEH
ncbi:hypothetical protein BGZ58_000431 [Dissophora ornata]|nr:hypothetical protein BGZ58_000431 [Dissophora ornata]